MGHIPLKNIRKFETIFALSPLWRTFGKMPALDFVTPAERARAGSVG
jgi:hypothetical protein